MVKQETLIENATLVVECKGDCITPHNIPCGGCPLGKENNGTGINCGEYCRNMAGAPFPTPGSVGVSNHQQANQGHAATVYLESVRNSTKENGLLKFAMGLLEIRTVVFYFHEGQIRKGRVTQINIESTRDKQEARYKVTCADEKGTKYTTVHGKDELFTAPEAVANMLLSKMVGV